MKKTKIASTGTTEIQLGLKRTTKTKAAMATAFLTAFAMAGGAQMALADPVANALDASLGALNGAGVGKFNLDARLRYESFDLDSSPDVDRDGSSIRVRYGYTTPTFNGFSAMVEGETLNAVFNDGNDIHPLDDLGDGTDLNQLWIQYANDAFGNVKVGRQLYTLDDHRFIGHVGWRQNIQTFDAVTAGFTAIDGLDVRGFYIDAQNSVTGDYLKHDSYGLNGSFSFDDWLKLTGFGYQIEGDEDGGANAAISNDTYGVRATGAIGAGAAKISYALSYANQEDNSGSPSGADFDADYYAADLSAGIAGATFGAGLEILEPDFRTPLATLHKFHGFADALLPITGFQQGLEDYYIYGGYNLGNGLSFKVIYHWYDPEDDAAGFDGGDELDLVAKYQFSKHANILAKYGNYDSDGGVGPSGTQGAFDKEMWTVEVNVKY